MATFKVGQRVRIVNTKEALNGIDLKLLGREGTIEAYKPENKNMFGDILPWLVRVDGIAPRCIFAERHLAPLTDPKAESFLESIRQLKPVKEIA